MDWWGEQGNSPDVQVALLLFSSSVMSDSLWPHGLQHIRLSCPSPSPGACSNSCPSCQRCHPTISPSVIPFSSCLQSFPASGSFLMDTLCIAWPEYWNFSLSISPSSDYPGLISFRIGLISLLSKGLSRVFSSTTVWKQPMISNGYFLVDSVRIKLNSWTSC